MNRLPARLFQVGKPMYAGFRNMLNIPVLCQATLNIGSTFSAFIRSANIRGLMASVAYHLNAWTAHLTRSVSIDGRMRSVSVGSSAARCPSRRTAPASRRDRLSTV